MLTVSRFRLIIIICHMLALGGNLTLYRLNYFQLMSTSDCLAFHCIRFLYRVSLLVRIPPQEQPWKFGSEVEGVQGILLSVIELFIYDGLCGNAFTGIGERFGVCAGWLWSSKLFGHPFHSLSVHWYSKQN